MQTSIKGMLAILHHEAVVLNRYKDIKGIWTIGAGVTHAAHAEIDPEVFTGEIDIEHALSSFRKVLKKYEDDVSQYIVRDMPQHVFDAFVSFHYNTGAIRRATFTKMYNSGRSDEDVANSMMQWIKPPALLARRRAEKLLFLRGDYGPTNIHLYKADNRGNINWHGGQTLHGETALALLERIGQVA